MADRNDSDVGSRLPLVRKLVLSSLGVLLLATSGVSFYRHRHLEETVVLSPGVTEVKRLSDYFDGVRGTINDCNLYFLEGQEPGATMLVMGGTHPEEPGGRLAAWLFAENAVMEQGRLIVVLSANRSATTVTRLGGAYPTDFVIPTDWGEQAFRMGDRWSNPLDQWPDPEVYIHDPSGQNLAYVDIRNLNRAWPGRPNGTLTERTTYALMELIRRERVDIVIDLHEAELQYPVISTIVAHDRGEELAAFVSMMLSDEEFNIGMEYSPKNLHGLSHREVGDYSDAVPLEFEAPEPFLDATRGRTTREQLLTGQDEFVMKAGEHGLLFERIDEHGWPIDVRVGRHTSAVLQTMESWTILNPDRPLSCRGVPRYAEVIEQGLGHWLHDPSQAPPGRVVIE
ncbi:MAG: succinylglutamate desuccinylase [Gemmatimonadales bacterium]|nr:succinylglutamate desuccinylase [Gemmatimonadales bacterium]NIN13196.1 succinylglutamate desuccinylase [Gemmatimonadales bacterium]NIN51474.1 succinylglutamate desuccinylase [Gemmatimonadales bacterium]NIP08938.1 succinylglutamate desuccinylase [Gemmatimonadales bacterium]NIR03726.1 succinylglutamate desuccinylase [Gemmatimonadales bacterium]